MGPAFAWPLLLRAARTALPPLEAPQNADLVGLDPSQGRQLKTLARIRREGRKQAIGMQYRSLVGACGRAARSNRRPGTEWRARGRLRSPARRRAEQPRR